MPLENILRVTESYQKLVDHQIRLELKDTRFPSEFQRALRHSLQAGGKRIRPTIVFLTCQAVGGKVEDASSAAAAIEMIHNATLIYDDIIDNDAFRRGRAALHVKFGRDLAILLAGIIVVRAIRMLSRREELSSVLSALSDLGFGEAMDIRAHVDDTSGYLFMTEKKTATLFRLGATIGGVVGGATSRQRKAIDAYGKNLGLAFQLRDDILGAIGREEDIGKPVGADVLNGRPSVVSIHLANELRISLDTLKQIAHDEGFSNLKKRKEFRMAVHAGRELCLKYGRQAKAALDVLPRSTYRRHLREIVDLAIRRSS